MSLCRPHIVIPATAVVKHHVALLTPAAGRRTLVFPDWTAGYHINHREIKMLHSYQTYERQPMPKLIKEPRKPKPNYKWFEQLLRDNKLSQRELARRLRMDAGGLNRRLKGRARLKLEEAAEIATLLGVPVDDVLVNAGVNVADHTKGRSKTVPVVGWVGGDMRIHLERVPGLRSIEAPPVPIAGLKALRFQTAMSRIDDLDGAILYFQPADAVDAEAIGKQCVVTTADGETLLRVVRPGYQRGRYNLTNRTDGTLTPDVVLESAARVIWMRL